MVSAVASPAGAGNGMDASGQATDSDGDVATKLAMLVNDAGALGKTAGVAIDQRQKNNTTAAGSQAKTGDGDLAVAAAIAVDASASTVQAYVPQTVSITRNGRHAHGGGGQQHGRAHNRLRQFAAGATGRGRHRRCGGDHAGRQDQRRRSRRTRHYGHDDRDVYGHGRRW